RPGAAGPGPAPADLSAAMTTTTPTTAQPDEFLLGSARPLRAPGPPVPRDRPHGLLPAPAPGGLGAPPTSHPAAPATPCAPPPALARYDQCFEAYFNARGGLPRPRPATAATEPARTEVPITDDDPGGAGGEVEEEAVRARASRAEVLRHRDVASLSPA